MKVLDLLRILMHAELDAPVKIQEFDGSYTELKLASINKTGAVLLDYEPHPGTALSGWIIEESAGLDPKVYDLIKKAKEAKK